MSEDLMEALRQNSDLLRAKNKRKFWARPFYEVMSGAIIWTDEIDRGWPTDVIWAMRSIFAYRTSCFVGEERADCRDSWESAKEWFPEWIGFSEQRTNPPKKVIDLYLRREAESDRQIDELLDGEDETGTKQDFDPKA